MSAALSPAWENAATWEEEGARCPYCGKLDTDTCDFTGLQKDGDRTTMNCGFCGREFRVTMSVSVEYETRPMPEAP